MKILPELTEEEFINLQFALRVAANSLFREGDKGSIEEADIIRNLNDKIRLQTEGE